MTKERNWKGSIIPVIVAVVLLILAPVPTITVQAAPQFGFGQGQGRTDTINENDFHTAAWDRFSSNYQFTSGSDHRFELGRPTTFNGFVPVDVFTVNIRRDANVSLRPPSYGVFSGQFAAEPTSRFFSQPVNPHFHQALMPESPNMDMRFDTLGLGVNASVTSNHLNIHNTNTGEFLPPTSIGN